MNDGALEPIAKALYERHNVNAKWERAFPLVQTQWKRQAQTLVHELLALHAIVKTFPEARIISR